MSAPQLHFRLPGTWHRIDLSGGAATETSIKTIARTVVGPADDQARKRAEVRRQLQQAVAAARQASASGLMFSTELLPGTPLPVTLSVFTPTTLRMSPAIGTEPDKVLAVLAEGLRQSEPEQAATIEHRPGAGRPALRTHRVEPVEPDELLPPETRGALRLVADYWVPVPDSKQVAMVRLSTPMGELENVMLSYFDVLIEATYFKRPNVSLLA